MVLSRAGEPKTARTPALFFKFSGRPGIAEIACSTGLSTDENARVINTDGPPIPGLYACGNDMASVMGGSYPGPGTTLGPAIVFAYRAAMHAKGVQI